MKTLAALKTTCLLLLSLALTSALAAPPKEVDELMKRGGLQPVKVKGLDLAYARPGASLAPYKRVIIDPVDVAFDKSWNPDRMGGRFKVSKEKREEIRTGVARLVQEEYVKELTAKGTYQQATEPAPDVLRVKLSIVNLYVTAPDSGNFGNVKTYAQSAGRMTLVAELSDSASKQVLARVADRREAGSSMMHMTGSGVNEQDARLVAADWARILHKALDNAHAGIGK